MDEAHTARAKERESHPTGAEGVEQTAQPAREPLATVAADSDESAVTSGTLEAAALDAAARGIDEQAAVRDSQAAASGSPEPEPEAAARELELDFDEADRYAASIRPSWADPEPPPPPVQPRQAIATSAVDARRQRAARVVRHNTRIDLNPPLRKRRGSAYAILGASLLGVAGLLYLGVTSSTVDHTSERGLGAKELAPSNAPPEPETSVQAAQTPTTVEPEPELRGPRLSDPEPGEPAAAIANPEGAEAPADPTAANAPEPPQLAAASDQATQNAAQAEPDQAVAAAAEEPQVAEAHPLAAAPQALAADAPRAQIAAAPQAPSADAPQTAPAAASQGLAAATPQAQTAAPNTQIAAVPPAQPAAAATTPAQAPRAAEPTAKLAAGQVPELKPLQPSAALASRSEAAGSNDKILLMLAAYPPSTRLRVDGVPVENPYKARVPKSSKHRIDAAAPGFAPETHVMRMEADVQLMISLKREPPRDVKADPYGNAARRTPTAAGPKRDRGAGFVAENPY